MNVAKNVRMRTSVTGVVVASALLVAACSGDETDEGAELPEVADLTLSPQGDSGAWLKDECANGVADPF